MKLSEKQTIRLAFLAYKEMAGNFHCTNPEEFGFHDISWSYVDPEEGSFFSFDFRLFPFRGNFQYVSYTPIEMCIKIPAIAEKLLEELLEVLKDEVQ